MRELGSVWLQYAFIVIAKMRLDAGSPAGVPLCSHSSLYLCLCNSLRVLNATPNAQCPKCELAGQKELCRLVSVAGNDSFELIVQTVSSEDGEEITLLLDELQVELLYNSSFWTSATCSHSSTARSDLSYVMSAVVCEFVVSMITYLEKMHIQVPLCVRRVEQQSAVFRLCAF